MEGIKNSTAYGVGTLESVLRESKSPGAKSFEVLNQYTKTNETVKLNIYQRLKLAFGSPVVESNRRYSGWNSALPFYVFKYNVRGETKLMLDYLHGHDDHFHTDFVE